MVETFKSADENCLLLKIKINGVLCALGSIYGPNENNENFYLGIKRLLQAWNLPFIVGGDFNTILDQSPGDSCKVLLPQACRRGCTRNGTDPVNSNCHR